MDKRTIDALPYLYNNSRFYKVKIVNLLSFFKTYQEEYDFLLANDYLIRERKYIRITDKGLSCLPESLSPLPLAYRLKLLKEKLSVYRWKKIAIVLTIISTVVSFIIKNGKFLLDLYRSLLP